MRLDDPHRTGGSNSGSWNRSREGAHRSHSEPDPPLNRYKSLAWILPTGIALSSISIWLVPPYLALMCLLLYWPEWRAEAKEKARRASRANAGALALTGRSHAVAGSASSERAPASDRHDHLANPHVHIQTNAVSPIGGDGVAIVEIESAGSSDETPAKSKKGRGRGRPRTKRPPVEIDFDRIDTSAWVQVKPGKFVRIEEAESDSAPFLTPTPNETSESHKSIDISALKKLDETEAPVDDDDRAVSGPVESIPETDRVESVDDRGGSDTQEDQYLSDIQSEHEEIGLQAGSIDVESPREAIEDVAGDDPAASVEPALGEAVAAVHQDAVTVDMSIVGSGDASIAADDDPAVGESIEPTVAEPIDLAVEPPISSNEAPFEALSGDDNVISVSKEFEPIYERSIDSVRPEVADPGRPTADEYRNTNAYEIESIAAETEIACAGSEETFPQVVIDDPLDSEFQAIDAAIDLGDEVDASDIEEYGIDTALNDKAEGEESRTVEETTEVACDVPVAESVEKTHSIEESPLVEPGEVERNTAEDHQESTFIEVETVENSQESSSVYEAIEESLVEESAGVVHVDRARHRALHSTNVHRDSMDRRRCSGNRGGSRRRVAPRSRSVVGRPFWSPRRLARPYVSRAPPFAAVVAESYQLKPKKHAVNVVISINT